MTKKQTPSNGIEPERIRLLASRLCWLKEGDDGLRFLRVDPLYGGYLREAERIAPQVLKPKPVTEPVDWKQLTFV
jgi:hypothetical protein